jgi:hypothetical protein
MKWNSLLLYIAADGMSLKSLLILPRKTIEKKLFEEDIAKKLAKFVYQEHYFIITIMFKEWCREVCLPELKSWREQFGYWGRAVLIMDVLTCHESNQMENFCFETSALFSSFHRTWASGFSPAMSECLTP